MNTRQIFYATISIVLLGILTIQFGCKKNSSNPDPIKKKYVWAVGSTDTLNNVIIFFSGDGGDTWIRQGEGSAELIGVNINDVWAVDENIVWAVGDSNVILKTTDGGINWARIPAPADPFNVDLNSISFVGTNNIWISGSLGTIYNSIDAGNTWIVIHSDVLNNYFLQGIHAINSNVVYVAGNVSSTHGFIARTVNGGQSWDSIVPAGNFNDHVWIGIASSDADHIVIYGATSHFMFSNNAGQTWKNDTVPDTGGMGGADINCLKMLDAQTWWGAFDLDYIGLTDNGGDSWKKQTSAGTSNMFLLGIDYYDKDLCVIVGESANGVSKTGKIIKTANGGQSWVSQIETDSRIKKVSFIK